MDLNHRAYRGPPEGSLALHPTNSSSINEVELWFGKIERDVIARGVFTSVFTLKRKLMRYIRRYIRPRSGSMLTRRDTSVTQSGTGH